MQMLIADRQAVDGPPDAGLLRRHFSVMPLTLRATTHAWHMRDGCGMRASRHPALWSPRA